MVPGGLALRDETERSAAARNLLQRRLGGDATGWRVVLDGAGGDGAAVAAAVQESFIEGLAAAATNHRLGLYSVEPLLCQAARRCRAALGRAATWLAVAEPGHLVLAAVGGGRWHTVRSHRLRGPLAQALPKLLEQTALIDGPAEVRNVIVATLGLPPIEWSEGGDWKFSPMRLDFEETPASAT
jgi:hypothetical protein